MSAEARARASASWAPRCTSSLSFASCPVLWSSTSLLRRATSATAAFRRTESSAPAARIVAIWRIFVAPSAAARTSCAGSAARRGRSWHVADISSVDALLSSVAAGRLADQHPVIRLVRRKAAAGRGHGDDELRAVGGAEHGALRALEVVQRAIPRDFAPPGLGGPYSRLPRLSTSWR